MTERSAPPAGSAEPAGSAGEQVLAVEHLTKTYGAGRAKRTVVDDVSFDLQAGRIVALVGESGSGKSTIGRMLTSLTRPSAGVIRLNGAEVRARSERARRQISADIQLILQDPYSSLNPANTVRYHLGRALRLHGRLGPGTDVDQAIAGLLADVNLVPGETYLGRRPHELSGGERQRVSIARALAGRPTVLIADEPVSMLDVSIRQGILTLLTAVVRERGIAMLYITHDLATVRTHADTVLVIHQGRIVENGPVLDVFGTATAGRPTPASCWPPSPIRTGSALSRGGSSGRWGDRPTVPPGSPLGSATPARPLPEPWPRPSIRGDEEWAWVGYAVRYRSRDWSELPSNEWREMKRDTVFDIASLTKLFTAVTVVRMHERGLLSIDDPLVRYLPEFAGGRRPEVTLRHLLTHSAGLPEDVALWRVPGDRAARLQAVVGYGPSGSLGRFSYSDIGYLLLGVMVERVTGARLDRVVEEFVAAPIGLRDTVFRPGDDRRERAAATEEERQPPRGLLCGEVHDEAAFALDGVAGHAGLFSTADDLLRFGAVVLLAARGQENPLLGPAAGGELLSPCLPRSATLPFDQCLGFRRGDPAVTPNAGTYGHTGFTGVSLVIDPPGETVGVLLTNRVHPTREGTGVAELRSDFGALVDTRSRTL
jgi:ABC-type oligopeptide transport system ATPase subunit/CubicO group peptidase (beta-lactamase class C family)